jgi:hypothetical protein
MRLFENQQIKKRLATPIRKKKYHLEIDREPYFCTFQYENAPLR